jgi:hypothetical protein
MKWHQTRIKSTNTQGRFWKLYDDKMFENYLKYQSFFTLTLYSCSFVDCTFNSCFAVRCALWHTKLKIGVQEWRLLWVTCSSAQIPSNISSQNTSVSYFPYVQHRSCSINVSNILYIVTYKGLPATTSAWQMFYKTNTQENPLFNSIPHLTTGICNTTCLLLA